MKQCNFCLLLVIMLLSAINCADDEIDTKPPHNIYSRAFFAGVEFKFDYNFNEVQLINHNDIVVKVKMWNYNKRSVMVNDLITMPGNTNHIRNLIFDQGDEILLEVWQGTASIWYGSFYGRPADYSGETFLHQGELTISSTTDRLPYLISLPVMAGADCELSGQFEQYQPYVQFANLLYCENVSSDTIRVHLYKLKLNSAGTGYVTDFELANFWIIAQLGQNTDIAYLDWNFQQNEPLALQIRIYDPFNTEIYEQHWGFFLDVASESYQNLNLPLNLP